LKTVYVDDDSFLLTAIFYWRWC